MANIGVPLTARTNLEIWVEVTQGHSKWYHSKASVLFRIAIMTVSLAVSTQYANMTERQTPSQPPHDGIDRQQLAFLIKPPLATARAASCIVPVHLFDCLSLYYAPAPIGEAGALGGHRCPSSVCPSVRLMSRTWALTRKPKGLGRRNFAQGTCDSHTDFKVKKSKVKVTGRRHIVAAT